jgi:hypothetical protein
MVAQALTPAVLALFEKRSHECERGTFESVRYGKG